MKAICLLTNIVVAVTTLNSYGQTATNFKSIDEVKFDNEKTIQDYRQFLENQETPFLNASSEIFVLDNMVWSRPYGETEYCLTPSMQNIKEYEQRIKQMNDKVKGNSKSTFHFVNVGVSDKSKVLLKQMNIYVPNYIENNVNVYLPEIDIDKFSESEVPFSKLSDYGTKTGELFKANVNNAQSTIWSEGFETNTVPGSNYNTVNGTVNCGWENVSCYQHSGSSSVWCASNGAACNACLGNYVNNMETYFAVANYINVANYTDIYFNYWIDLDLNNSGTNDEFKRYDDLGFGTWSLQFTATSANSWDGQLWQNGSVNYTGQSFSQYAFQFSFTSNWTGTSYGVYLDDLQLTGTPTTGMENKKILNDVNLYPNPNTGKFTLEMELAKPEDVWITVVNITGQVIHQEILKRIFGKHKQIIDLSNYDKGIYTIRLISQGKPLYKKIVIQ